MKNTSSKYLTIMKLLVIIGVVLILIVALCDFTPSSQTQELVIPFTR